MKKLSNNEIQMVNGGLCGKLFLERAGFGMAFFLAGDSVYVGVRLLQNMVKQKKVSWENLFSIERGNFTICVGIFGMLCIGGMWRWYSNKKDETTPFII